MFKKFSVSVLFAVVLVGGVARSATGQPTPSSIPSGGQAPPAPVTIVPVSNARVASSTDPVLLDSPVAFWLLDDPSGSVADDSVRSPKVPHPGTYQGATSHSMTGPVLV